MPRWRVMIPIDGFQIYDVDAKTPESAFDEILAGNGQVQFEGTIFQNLEDVKKKRKPKPAAILKIGAKSCEGDLVEWIRKRGQPVTSSEVQRGLYAMRKPGAAKAALAGLVASGLGVLSQSPSGRTEAFTLKENQ